MIEPTWIKRGVRDPALLLPNIAFACDKALPYDAPHPLIRNKIALVVSFGIILKHLLDTVRMDHQEIRSRAKVDFGYIAKLLPLAPQETKRITDKFRKIIQW
jgi:hypothetical protein